MTRLHPIQNESAFLGINTFGSLDLAAEVIPVIGQHKAVTAELFEALEEKEQPFVVGVRSTCHVASAFSYRSIAEAFGNGESLNWYRVSERIGTKGPRVYDWCAFRCMHPYEKEWSRMAICRRSVDDPSDVRYFLAFCKSDIYAEEIIAAAGRRWTTEEDFEVTKGELGLDHYEVRSVRGWYRHVTLCMAAQALLASERAQLQSTLDLDSGLIKKTPI
jgi:SRSO17 transposase